MTPDLAPEKRPEKRSEKRSEKRRSDLERDSARGARLDTPLEPRRRANALSRIRGADNDRFGVFAERFARFMGTAKFLLYMTVFVLMWVALNVVSFIHHWDPYPFILLNLFFSTQASYAAPLILLAQNRQEDRDRVVAEQDRRADAASHADMEFLAREVASLRMALGEVATRDFMRSELRGLLSELEERVQDDDDAGEQDHVPGRPTEPAGDVG